MRHALARAALLVGLTLAPAAPAEDETPLAPEDFAHGRLIVTTGDAPLQTLLIDLPIYRGSIGLRLADVRVMNGAGEPVPHAVRPLSGPARETRRDRDLPIFALRDAEPEGADVAVAADGARTYRIKAEVGDRGALVEVESEPPGAASDQTPPPAYLLDASQLGAAITRLEFDLAAGEAGFVVPVRIEGSNDLSRFHPVLDRSVLVRLEQDGHQIDKSFVALPSSRHRYLRVSWPEAPLPVQVRGVRARLAPRVAAPPRERTRVIGRPVPNEAGALLFDLGGKIPVDRAQVLLPQPNTLVQARLSSGRSADGPWRLQQKGLLYDLQYGETLRNPELSLSAGRHRYLKLEVAPGGGGLKGTPQLEVSWYPEQLLFVARGEPPFQVVYGRSGAPTTPFSTRELLKAWPRASSELPRASARMGDEFALGDPSVLEPPVPPPPYRTWALWSVLLLAVGAVLAMSASLLRQMRSRGA
ncbi:MAG: DUF3999 domain-containing protein [Myxococcota bacterium]